MASSLMELARSGREDVEVYENAVGCVLTRSTSAKNQHLRVVQQHHVSELVKSATKRCREVAGLLEDEDGGMQEEVKGMRGTDSFDKFYAQLKEIKTYHARFPNIMPQGAVDVQAELNLLPEPSFSGEEVFGKFLDLHEIYERFCNMPQQFDRCSYAEFLERFHRLDQVAESKKGGAHYARYVGDLLTYLESAVTRVQPLVDLEDIMSEAVGQFAVQWEEGTVSGWRSGKALAKGNVDLSAFSTAGELELSLGADGLKRALMARGLKCGGTPADRARRLFSVKGLADDQIPSKLFAKGRKPPEGGNAAASDPRRALAEKEHRIIVLMEQPLAEVLESTKRQVAKKQTRTKEELEAEVMEEIQGALPEMNAEGEYDEDSDDEDIPYNPLNIPLGWDGKPIPYWLYKLHGLGVEFKCEICGNFSYWGRRAFDRHFQDWRHAHGMRCLKIPNTKHFHDITLIQDAVNLYGKLKHQIDLEQYDVDKEEEFEDTAGNVLDRRTYEALARQDLL